MTLEQQQRLIEISEKLGIDDYEFLYICAMLTIDLIATIILYSLIIKTWRIYKRRSSF
jgi:hypothetical protein